MKAAGPHRPKGHYGRRGLPAELVDAMYADYVGGLSLEAVGKKYGRTRQSIFGIFAKRKLALRAKVFLPVVEYGGRKFTCQKTCGRHRYLRNTVRRDRVIYLHHVIWEEHHGPIPRGHKIAFRDGDHGNCAIENLELLTNSDQVRKYACKGENQFTVTARGRLDALMRHHAGGGGSLAAKLKGSAA